MKRVGRDHAVLNPQVANGPIGTKPHTEVQWFLFPSPFMFPSPTADASLLPVRTISGPGVSMSSGRSSGCSGLSQRTQLLTTEAPVSHAGNCLPPSSTRELNVLCDEYPSNIPVCQLPLLPSAALEVSSGPFALPVLSHCPSLLTASCGPAAAFHIGGGVMHLVWESISSLPLTMAHSVSGVGL